MKRPHIEMRGMKRGKGKREQTIKSLSGKQRQTDTLSEMPTMGNPGGKKTRKAREKRLEKAAV